MTAWTVAECRKLVALLAEGVGRNSVDEYGFFIAYQVALLAEGVGRNFLRHFFDKRNFCRPPRGGRG